MSKDIFSLSVLVLYKDNQREFQISHEKAAEIIQSTVLIALIQTALIFCIGYYLAHGLNKGILTFNAQGEVDANSMVFTLAKALSLCVMHLLVFKEC